MNNDKLYYKRILFILGVTIFFCGAASNLLVMNVNNGSMPTADSTEDIEWSANLNAHEYISSTENKVKLFALSDIIPIKTGNITAIFSIGDLMIFLGYGVMFWAVIFIMDEFDKEKKLEKRLKIKK